MRSTRPIKRQWGLALSLVLAIILSCAARGAVGVANAQQPEAGTSSTQPTEAASDKEARAETIPAEATPAQATPESVASRYMEAMRRGDWAASARLMHPDALRQLKQMFRPIVLAEPTHQVGITFFNVRTPAEYDRLPSEQAFERLMRGLIQMRPELRSAVATSQFEIIGHVTEAPDVAHVVYRMKVTTQGIGVTKTAVMSLRRSGASWRGLLSGDIEGLAAALSRAGIPRGSSGGAKPSVKPAPQKPTSRQRRP